MTKSESQKIIEILNEHTKQFEKINQRFVGVDARLESMEVRQNTMDGKLDRVVGKLLQHDMRFAEIEEKMATKEDVNMLQVSIDALALKTERLDQEFVLFSNK